MKFLSFTKRSCGTSKMIQQKSQNLKLFLVKKSESNIKTTWHLNIWCASSERSSFSFVLQWLKIKHSNKRNKFWFLKVWLDYFHTCSFTGYLKTVGWMIHLTDWCNFNINFIPNHRIFISVLTISGWKNSPAFPGC